MEMIWLSTPATCIPNNLILNKQAPSFCLNHTSQVQKQKTTVAGLLHAWMFFLLLIKQCQQFDLVGNKHSC